MSTVSLQELQRDLLGLLQRVERGESILLTRGDQPVAELRPIVHTQAVPRPFGLAAGAFTIPADFDDPLPDDILQGFDGR